LLPTSTVQQLLPSQDFSPPILQYPPQIPHGTQLINFPGMMGPPSMQSFQPPPFSNVQQQQQQPQQFIQSGFMQPPVQIPHAPLPFIPPENFQPEAHHGQQGQMFTGGFIQPPQNIQLQHFENQSRSSTSNLTQQSQKKEEKEYYEHGYLAACFQKTG
jgi:hypothetical protein